MNPITWLRNKFRSGGDNTVARHARSNERRAAAYLREQRRANGISYDQVIFATPDHSSGPTREEIDALFEKHKHVPLIAKYMEEYPQAEEAVTLPVTPPALTDHRHYGNVDTVAEADPEPVARRLTVTPETGQITSIPTSASSVAARVRGAQTAGLEHASEREARRSTIAAEAGELAEFIPPL